MKARRSVLIVLLLAAGLAACGDDKLREDIIGRWVITDPGGRLAGGSVEFRRDGRVLVTETVRSRDGIRRHVLFGTYVFTDSSHVRMELREAGGRPVKRKVGVGLREGWLTLHFRTGQVVYRRARTG